MRLGRNPLRGSNPLPSANIFMNQSSILPKIVKKVMPTVVSIIVSENISEIPEKLISQKDRKKLEKIANHNGDIEIGGGSGFIIDKFGVILTNKHIISDPNADYTIITSDGTKHQAKILEGKKDNDIAILKISKSRK